MVKAFSKALLYYALPIFCFIVSGLSQSPLRRDLNHAITGSEKFNTALFPSIADQLKKLSHIRNPRQIDSGKLYMDHGDVWVVQGFKNFRGCPKAALQFKVFQNAEDWYAVIATSAVENNTEIYSFSALNGCEKLLETLPTRLAFDFEVVRTNDVIRIVVLEKTPAKYPHKRIGSSVYTVNFATNVTISASSIETLRRREALRSEDPTCITTWEQFGIPHVAICNGKNRDFRGIESYWAKSYIYCASGGYFDRCGEIETHFPKAIRHFRIFSKHYLAVANYPNETVVEDVPTEILRYDLGSKMYKQLQLLPTKGASDLCFLDIGTGLDTLHFLVVVNRLTFDSTGKPNNDATSHVYKFIGEKFEPFQSIAIDSKTTGCLAFQENSGKSALIFSTWWGVDVYQYNGWRFVSVVQYSSFALGSGINTLGTLKMNGETFITVANSNPAKSYNDNFFSLKFSHQLNATLSTVYSKGMSRCHQLRSELEVDPLRLITELYPAAVKKNDTVIQLGKVDFSSLKAGRVWTNQVVLKSNMSRLGATQVIQLKRLSNKMEQLGQKLQALTRRFKLAMRTNGDYVTHGNVHFKSLVSTCRGSDKLPEGCVFENVTAKTINSVDIAGTYQQAIINSDKPISSLKTKRLELRNGHPIKTTSLSGRGIKEYMTVDEDLKFRDKIRIEGSLLVNGYLSVKGLVDDREISPNTLLLRQGMQHLNWTLKTSDVHLKNLKAHYINGRNISHLYQNAISNTGNFTLLQPKFFSSLSVTKLDLNGLINQINLTTLESNSMKLAGAQVVTGIHGYINAHLGRAVLNGSLNEKRFPADFVSVGKNDHLNFKKLQLTQDATMVRLTVTENIDDMRVTNGSWGTNLIKKSSIQKQMVTGKKRFENLNSSSNVSSKTLNQRPMDVFATKSSLYGHTEELLIYDSVTVQGDVTFEKPLSVNDTEGVGIQMLEENGILLSTKDFPPLRSITFKDNVRINGDLTPVKLDGVLVSDFITKDRKIPFDFNGRKEFSNPVSMNHTFTLLYTLNGYDLRDLWKRSLKIDGDQMLPGALIIKNDVDIVKIKAQNSQLVSLTSPTVLTGNKHFQKLVIEKNWFVDTLNVAGLFNDVDMSSWQNDTVLKTGEHQTIISQKSLISLTAQNAEIVAMDDLDIKRVLDVVLVHKPATLYSDIVLNGTVFANGIVVKGNIDGVNSNAPLNWLRYGVNQNLSGNVEIRGSLHVGDFRQDSWMVNAVDLNVLLKDAVRINDLKEFSSLRFDHIVIDNLNVEGLIQGHNVTEELVLKDSKVHRNISGVKSFAGPLVSDSLRVEKDLNGLDPKQVCQNPIPPQTSKWIVYGNVFMKRHAKLNTSKVNDLMLSETTRHLWVKEANVNIKPQQKFKDVIMNGVLSERTINKVNFTDWSQRSVKLSSRPEQRINAFHRFQSLQASNITVESLNSSRINDIDVNHITHAVLLRDTEQNISNHITFQDVIALNVTVDGLLNEVDVNTTLMRIDRENVVTGKKSVKTLLVQGSIDVCSNCSVGTFDISHWASRAVLRKGNFTLPGAKFESLVFQQPLNLNGTLNNVAVSRDLVLTLSDQQEMNGRLSLSSLLPHSMLYSSEQLPLYQQSTEGFKVAAQFMKLQVNGLYDGISLPHFYDQLVRRDTGVVFSEPVVLSSLIASNLHDSSTNSTIGDIITLPLNATHHVADSPEIPQETRQRPLSSLVQKIKRVVSRQSVELRFFEEMTVPGTLPRSADSFFAWETRGGEIELCSYDEAQGELFYSSSTSPLMKGVDLRGVAYLRDTEDFAVAALNRSSSSQEDHDSFIFSPKASGELKRQTIPTDFPIGATAFLLSNSSCYLFLEMASDSPIYCRSLGSNGTYALFQLLPTVDGRLVTVGYHYSTGLPLLTIASVAQRGYGHITVWNFNVTSGWFQPWKTIVTLQIVALDCVCNEAQCLLVTVAPSKPAAIPGQVIIWSLNDVGPPTRLQRIAFSEPIDAKFSRLPDGRLILMVLQTKGVDNVSVYVWRGLLQFQHDTTVRVPGAKFLQLISNDAKLMLALSVTSSVVTELPYGPLRMFRAQFVGQLSTN